MKSLIKVLMFVIVGISTANADIHYKTLSIQEQFEKLADKNNKLYQIVIDINLYAETVFDKSIVITEVYRTQKEQDRYYRGKKKFRSPHQDWLAVDLRSRNFTEKEVKNIVDTIKSLYNSKNTYIPTAFYHDIGLGKHIHIQFKERK